MSSNKPEKPFESLLGIFANSHKELERVWITFMEDDTFVLCIFSLGEGPKAFEDVMGTSC